MENDAPDDEHRRVNRRPVQSRVHNGHTPKSNTLMSTRRLNTDNEDYLSFDSGLFSPPSSQVGMDASRMLISPPPEEVLRSTSKHSSSLARSTSTNTPFSTRPALPKRKRPTNPGSASNPPLSVSRETPKVAHILAVDHSTESTHAAEATPNPKPRKQSKRHTRSISVDSPTHATLSRTPSSQQGTRASRNSRSPSIRSAYQSPHATNPSADYILPSFSSHGRSLSYRRSITPMPPYEPPRENFTPPREVFVTSIASHVSKVSKSTKRRSVGKVLKVAIKNEPPVVDLSLPLPPPSPTDDPLLLSAPPIPPKPRSSGSKSRLAGLKIDHIPAFRRSLPRISPTSSSPSSTPPLPDSNDARDPDVRVTEPDSALPWFEPDDVVTSNGGWDDSSSEDGSDVCQTDEYREQFTVLTVPTKLDSPPSRRGDKVNRSTSPFPGARRVSRIASTTNFEPEAEEMDGVTSEIEDTREVRRPLEHPSMERDSEQFTPRLLGDQASDLGADQDTACVSPEDYYAPQDFDHDMAVATDLSRDHDLPCMEDYDMTSPAEHDTDTNHNAVDNETSHSAPDSLDATSSVTRYATKYPTSVKDKKREREEVGPFPELIHDDSYFPSSAPKEDISLRHRRTRDTPSLGSPHKRDTISQHNEREIIDSKQVSSTDDDEDDDSDSMDVGLVRITSHDPRAAARAAAILKQHDYDCFTRVVPKNRRHSHSTLDSILLSAKRKGISRQSGIVKSTVNARDQLGGRRATFGGVVGDRVIIPGSPAITLTELLQEAEITLEQKETPLSPAIDDDPFTVSLSLTPPVFSARSDVSQLHEQEGVHALKREWTRDDWKLLDACFTEERVEIGKRLDLGPNALANVDDVRNEDIVKRFVLKMGGSEILDTMGPGWTCDSLSTRVHTLRRKQRYGSPVKCFSPSPTKLPELTPISLGLPRDACTPQTNTSFKDKIATKTVVTPSPLSPGYSNLLQEGNVIGSENTPHQSQLLPEVSTPAPGERMQDLLNHRDASPEVPPSISTQLKGLLWSYLPGMPKTTRLSRKTQQTRPGLPLPPREVLEKPRGPISTPSRPPLPKQTHPKELVHLHPAPPPKLSMIPRVSKPQRLVELHPPPPPPTIPPVPMPRKSSVGSVKDLVRNFEERQAESRNVQLKSFRSIGDLSKGTRKGFNKPVWRP